MRRIPPARIRISHELREAYCSSRTHGSSRVMDPVSLCSSRSVSRVMSKDENPGREKKPLDKKSE